MRERLRPGRKIDINLPGLEPITVTILSEDPRILAPHPEFTVAEDGELVLTGGRKERLIQIYTDLGMRTLSLASITLR